MQKLKIYYKEQNILGNRIQYPSLQKFLKKEVPPTNETGKCEHMTNARFGLGSSSLAYHKYTSYSQNETKYIERNSTLK